MAHLIYDLEDFIQIQTSSFYSTSVTMGQVFAQRLNLNLFYLLSEKYIQKQYFLIHYFLDIEFYHKLFWQNTKINL